MFEEIRPLQLKQLQILKELKRVCDSNGIAYFLAYGTLIGAVRHEGFIPWDDDVDVCMNYPDYVRFQEICKTQLHSGFFLQTAQTDPHAGLSYNKLRLNGSTLIVDYLSDRDMHHGINIDIYPVYNVPDNYIERTLQKYAAAVYMLLESGKAPENHGGTMAHVSKMLLSVFRGNTRTRIKEMCHTYMARFEDRKTKEKAFLFGNLSICGRTYPAEVFSGTVNVQFEGETFSAPVGYDVYLRMYYGDYMKIPPIEEQGVKLEHITKISLDEPYQKFKGTYYCVE